MLPSPLTLQERVRQFNLGTPTAMHVGTHKLVNDLWKANAVLLAELKNCVWLLADLQAEPGLVQRQARSAISAVAGDRPAVAQPQIQREGETS